MPESGARVPSVNTGSDSAPAPSGDHLGAGNEVDRDVMCPICMQTMKDAFLTACGHSYCYMCIATHLRNKNDCPCCGRYLTVNLIFPNFAVDKLLKKISERQVTNSGSYTEQICEALSRQDCEFSVKDLDLLISILTEKKRKMEQEEAEINLKVLLEFLVCLRKKKMEILEEIQNDLRYIKEDIHAVQKFKLNLFNVYTVRSRAANDLASREDRRMVTRPVADDCLTPEPTTSGKPYEEEDNVNAPVCSQALSVNDVSSIDSELQHLAHSERFIERKRQIQEQFSDLQECYLQKRRHLARHTHEPEGRDLNDASRSCYHEALEDFQSVLSSITRYSKLKVIAELRHGDIFHSLNIVSSIEFDRDDELFATAGVSRQIKVSELSSVVNEPAQVHCAVVDIATRSKLSCLSWNKYTKQHIASSDYEGIVTVWDVTTRQSVREYEEHEKRAWSVDFSRTQPSLLFSGGDDCKVKVWCTRQEESVLNINMNANICSVKCNPGSMHVAVGSADHDIHYFDLRNVSEPLHVFSGHRKTVSYVKFLSTHELASASTDSTLRLWDVKENSPVRIYRGHTNEKNFVGLTANSEYISCGSETNEVFVYHKAISRPVTHFRFNSSELDDMEQNRGPYFISAVGWKSDSSIVLAANSQGTIKVLSLAP